MDDNSLNDSKTTLDHSLSPNENDDLGKLKMDGFLLRLRCYNLETQLNRCICPREDNDIQNELSHVQRKLNEALSDIADLKKANGRLYIENQSLTEKNDDINDDLKKKISDYNTLLMKYEPTSLAVNNGSLSTSITQIIENNDHLNNIISEYKREIRYLKKKLNEVNNLHAENDLERNKSLTANLIKTFKEHNDSSFLSTSLMSKQCFDCDALKVKIDKLSETVIKHTVNIQALNKTIADKQNEIAALEKELLAAPVEPNVDAEQLTKYKVISKQCMRKLLVERDEKEELQKKFEELSEFYLQHQREQELEIETLKNKERISNEENNKMGQILVHNLNQVEEAHIDFLKSLNISNSMADNCQVGQYSPQYRIQQNLSIISDSDSVYYDRNVSLDNTMFERKPGDNSFSFGNIDDALENIQTRIRELGEVVQGYLTKVGSKGANPSMMLIQSFVEENTANTSIWSNAMIGNNDSELSLRETSHLKQLYEDEKQRFDNLLEEKESEIKDLAAELETVHQDIQKLTVSHAKAIEAMSLQYTNDTTKYFNKTKKLQEKIQNSEMENLAQNDRIGALEEEIRTKEATIKDNAKNIEVFEEDKSYQNETIERLEEDLKYLNDQIEENRGVFNNRVSELEKEIESLNENLFDCKEIIILNNDNLMKKMDEMEAIFVKLKSIIVDHSNLFPIDAIDANANSMDANYTWQMLELVQSYLEQNNVIKETASKCQNTSNLEQYNIIRETASKCQNTSNFNASENSLDDFQGQEMSLNTENRFYTSSLNLRSESPIADASPQSPIHFNDLTNVSELNDQQLSGTQKVNNENKIDKYKYISENPEKIHKKLKYFWETCEQLKQRAIYEHELNKKLLKQYSTPFCKMIDDMSKQIEDFKRQLELCKECFVSVEGSMSEELINKLKELQLL